MKLLIVDDQFSTALGIAQKIDWAAEGIEQVAVAQDAMEARLEFKQQIPDIMLCDIEMPVESGLDLCRWVAQQQYPTQVIFLTCHADFEYAQEAISLHAVDYIVQPAPYDKIRDAVKKAIAKSRQLDAAQKKMAELERNMDAFHAELLGRFLRGDSTTDLQKNLGSLALGGSINYVILLQIVRWTSLDEYWQGTLMCSALDNFVREIFEPAGCISLVSYMEQDVYAIALQQKPDSHFNSVTLEQSLNYLCGVFKMYMPCLIACYPEGPLELLQLPASWNELQKRKEQNVTRRTGVFGGVWGGDAPADADNLLLWKELLQGYDPLRFADETIRYIDSLTEQGNMNKQTLHWLYQELVKFLYNAGDSGNLVEQVFANAEAAELYRNAVRSVDDMKCFIRCVQSLFVSSDTVHENSRQLVSFVMHYVEAHVTEDIRIEDLANEVHLSTDYLSRLFKKEQGCTIKTYIIQQKMLEARNLLRGTSMPVGAIAAKLGYFNFSHFSSAYKKVMGCAPSEERG